MTCPQTVSQMSSEVSGKTLSVRRRKQSSQGDCPREVLGTPSYDISELGSCGSPPPPPTPSRVGRGQEAYWEGM